MSELNKVNHRKILICFIRFFILTLFIILIVLNRKCDVKGQEYNIIYNKNDETTGSTFKDSDGDDNVYDMLIEDEDYS